MPWAWTPRRWRRRRSQFQPLPHRLQTLGIARRHGAIGQRFHQHHAACQPSPRWNAFRGRRVAILVGGYDRGLDWGMFARSHGGQPPKGGDHDGPERPAHPRDDSSRCRRRPSGSSLAEAVRDGRRPEAWRCRVLGATRALVLLSPRRAEFPALPATTSNAAGISPRPRASIRNRSARFRAWASPDPHTVGYASGAHRDYHAASLHSTRRIPAMRAVIALCPVRPERRRASPSPPSPSKVSWTARRNRPSTAILVWDDASKAPSARAW